MTEEVKQKLSKCIKKGIYLAIAAAEKTNGHHLMYVFVIDSIIGVMTKICHKYPSIQPLISRILTTELNYCAPGKRTKLENSGHDDYTDPKPHMVESEDCHCSVLSVLLRHTNNMSKRQLTVLQGILKELLMSLETKQAVAVDIFNHFIYLFDIHNSATFNDNTPPFIELLFSMMLNPDIAAAVTQRANCLNFLVIIRDLLKKWGKVLIPELGGYVGISKEFYAMLQIIYGLLKCNNVFFKDDESTHLFLEQFELIHAFNPKLRPEYKADERTLTYVVQTWPGTISLFHQALSWIVGSTQSIGAMPLAEYSPIMKRVLITLKKMILDTKAKDQPNKDAGVISLFPFLEYCFLIVFNYAIYIKKDQE